MKKFIIFMACIFLVHQTANGFSLFGRKKNQNVGVDQSQNNRLLLYVKNFLNTHRGWLGEYNQKTVMYYYESGYGRSPKTPIEFTLPQGIDEVNGIGMTNIKVVQFCRQVQNPAQIYVRFWVLGSKNRQRISNALNSATTQAMVGMGSVSQNTGSHRVLVNCEQALNKVCRNTCASDFCVTTESVGVACSHCLGDDNTKSLKGVQRCIDDFNSRFIYNADNMTIQQRRAMRKGVLGNLTSALGDALTGTNDSMAMGAGFMGQGMGHPGMMGPMGYSGGFGAMQGAYGQPVFAAYPGAPAY